MKVDSSHLHQARAATNANDLISIFQKALQIEHATIPPYLAALYSLKAGSNKEIHNVIESVVIEEMLHVTICANIIRALGGKVNMTDHQFIPDYPSELPLGIADHLIVGIEKYSPQLVHDVFMKIERPDHPLGEDEEWHDRLGSERHHTLGLLYRLLQKNLKAFPNEMLPGNKKDQTLSDLFTTDQLFPITNIHEAVEAIDIIIDQGEGSSHSPLDKQKEPGHFYRFAEIYHCRKIKADADECDGFGYHGDEIEYIETDVYPLISNNRFGFMETESDSYRASLEFTNAYAALLEKLEIVFNSDPGGLDEAVHGMRVLKKLAHNVCCLPLKAGSEYNTGLIFKF
jgi:hypothetical protein